MFGFRDKKDIKTIKDLDLTISYLKAELEQTKKSLKEMTETADLRLKEITRLKKKLDKYEKEKVTTKKVAKKNKIMLY